MWLLHNQELKKTMDMPKQALESKMFVGHVKNPIATIERKEVFDYQDEEFFKMYNIWKKFHLGFGIPGNKCWSQSPMFMIDIIETIESEYRAIRA